jgi:hypothetical protein
MQGHPATNDATASAGDWDQGACCNSAENFVKLAGYIGLVGTMAVKIDYVKGTSAG